MKVISIIAAFAVIAVVSGTNQNGVVYPFDINNQLICYVDNPLKGLEGQEDVVPESIPRLPFAQIVKQGDFPNDIWLPPNLTFRIPPGIPNAQMLLNFLGSDYNPIVTSTFRPRRQAPLACVDGVGTEGSGGILTSHVPTSQTPTPVLNFENSSANMAVFDRVYNEIRVIDTSHNVRVFSNFNEDRLRTAQFILLQETNNQPELCEIWTGLCPLTTVWGELPLGYFPPFFSQGTCSGKNCSFPRAKLCEEDFSYVGYATVLRWDCCYNKELGQVRWDCGWRKVQVPIVCDCTCACSEVFHT